MTKFYSPRESWTPGPWTTEPDEVAPFEHAGLKCWLIRRPSGHWCGYVAVPADHALHGVSYDHLYDIDVHGSITFSDQEDAGWTFGFDCNHWSDLAPANLFAGISVHNKNAVYRDQAYATAEVRHLAEQLAGRA